jgi:hypothetical protein
MRMGTFSRLTHSFGPSLSVIKPKNNDPGSVIPPELLDRALGLNESQRRELAQDIQDLYNLYRGERDLF